MKIHTDLGEVVRCETAHHRDLMARQIQGQFQASTLFLAKTDICIRIVKHHQVQSGRGDIRYSDIVLVTEICIVRQSEVAALGA